MIYTIYGKSGQRNPDNLVAVPKKMAPWALIASPIWWWLATYALFVLFTSAIAAASFAVVSMAMSWLLGVYRCKLEESGMMLGRVDLARCNY